MTSPVTVPSVENRAGSLAALGWTGRDCRMDRAGLSPQRRLYALAMVLFF